MRWTAIVLAGSRPGGDPLARELGAELKALIPVAGLAMVRRPVEALLASEYVGDVRVLAQEPERIAAALPADARLKVERSKATIAETLLAMCDDPATAWPLLVTTADHALLDTAMIRDFCSRVARSDIAIGVVERRALLARFPDARRTWLAFKGGAYSGANLFALRTPKVAAAVELWRSVEQDRKKGFRLLWTLGPALFAGAALRLRTLDWALRAIGRRLGTAIRAIELSDPTAAIDVDKPDDLALAERIIEGRS